MNLFSIREKHVKLHLLTVNTFVVSNHHTYLLNYVFNAKQVLEDYSCIIRNMLGARAISSIEINNYNSTTKISEHKLKTQNTQFM